MASQAMFMSRQRHALAGADTSRAAPSDDKIYGEVVHQRFQRRRQGDILWQNTDGTPAVWLMNGTNVVPGAQSRTGLARQGAGDFNGDGKADILWQNDDGTPAVWLMNGTNVVTQGPPAPIPARLARQMAPATSTATARPTSCGRTTTARPRSG